jgi:hypothetical protein
VRKVVGLGALALLAVLGSLLLRPAELPSDPTPAPESVAESRPDRSPASSPAAPSPGASVVSLAGKIRATKACYEQECDFPSGDARAYDFAVGRALAAQLSEYRSRYASDSSFQGEAGALAREFMEVPDGFVQEEAIKILAELPPSRENVEAMILGLENAHSPPLIEQAMREWERYLGSPEEALIQEFLADLIARGGQFASEKASEKILAFLNERSESAFRAALASMLPESTPARHLRAALEEYARIRSGG